MKYKPYERMELRIYPIHDLPKSDIVEFAAWYAPRHLPAKYFKRTGNPSHVPGVLMEAMRQLMDRHRVEYERDKKREMVRLWKRDHDARKRV